MTEHDTLLLDARDAATMCRLSKSTWHKLVASGKAPKPIKLGRSSRWNRGELEDWIAAGCPARYKWTITRNAK